MPIYMRTYRTVSTNVLEEVDGVPLLMRQDGGFKYTFFNTYIYDVEVHGRKGVVGWRGRGGCAL